MIATLSRKIFDGYQSVETRPLLDALCSDD